jgi:O-antigen/teichoic acid export membrane protein
MIETKDRLFIGDKYGLVGVVVLVAGCALAGYGVKTADGLTDYLFQRYPLVMVPLIVGATGVSFLLLSYRAHMRSWKVQVETKLMATAVILFLASIMVFIAKEYAIAAAIFLAVSGVVCLLFAIWHWSTPFMRRLKDRHRKMA